MINNIWVILIIYTSNNNRIGRGSRGRSQERSAELSFLRNSNTFIFKYIYVYISLYAPI